MPTEFTEHQFFGDLGFTAQKDPVIGRSITVEARVNYTDIADAVKLVMGGPLNDGKFRLPVKYKMPAIEGAWEQPFYCAVDWSWENIGNATTVTDGIWHSTQVYVVFIFEPVPWRLVQAEENGPTFAISESFEPNAQFLTINGELFLKRFPNGGQGSPVLIPVEEGLARLQPQGVWTVTRYFMHMNEIRELQNFITVVGSVNERIIRTDYFNIRFYYQELMMLQPTQEPVTSLLGRYRNVQFNLAYQPNGAPLIPTPNPSPPIGGNVPGDDQIPLGWNRVFDVEGGSNPGEGARVPLFNGSGQEVKQYRPIAWNFLPQETVA